MAGITMIKTGSDILQECIEKATSLQKVANDTDDSKKASPSDVKAFIRSLQKAADEDPVIPAGAITDTDNHALDEEPKEPVVNPIVGKQSPESIPDKNTPPSESPDTAPPVDAPAGDYKDPIPDINAEKGAMDSMLALCSDATKNIGNVKIAEGKALMELAKKLYPWLGGAVIGAGATGTVNYLADKKEDPQIYESGIRRGYVAGADAFAKALLNSNPDEQTE